VDVVGEEGAPSRYVSWDEVVESRPEVMILMPCGYDLARTFELVPEVASRPGFETLECTRSGRVLVVDGSAYFSRPGPRIVHGLELIAAAVRGEPAPAGAVYWNQPATSRMALISPSAL
jgi:iron complex transport system substrate-binding protein